MRLLAIAAVAAFAASAAASEKFDLWPEGKMPGRAAEEPEVAKVEDTWIGKKDKVLIIRNVSKPSIELFRVGSDKPTGLVVVCPGGGYGMKAAHEGAPDREHLLLAADTACSHTATRVRKSRSG